MTAFLVVIAGVLLLVGVAFLVVEQSPPDPEPWVDGDTAGMDPQYRRDERLDDPAERLRATLMDDGYPSAEVDLIVARYQEWLDRARDAS